MAAPAAAMLLLAAALSAVPSSVPRLQPGPGQAIDILLPAAVLRGADVRRQLRSGLTAAFVASIDERAGGRRIRGGVRIEIRYELWDETYLVRAIAADGQRQTAVLPSEERLVEWWSGTPMRILGADRVPRRQPIRIKLEMIPFSAGEEADARRWLADSVGRAGEGSSQGDPRGAGVSTASAGGILDLIIGTSVQRRAIQSWQWTVRLP